MSLSSREFDQSSAMVDFSTSRDGLVCLASLFAKEEALKQEQQARELAELEEQMAIEQAKTTKDEATTSPRSASVERNPNKVSSKASSSSPKKSPSKSPVEEGKVSSPVASSTAGVVASLDSKASAASGADGASSKVTSPPGSPNVGAAAADTSSTTGALAKRGEEKTAPRAPGAAPSGVSETEKYQLARGQRNTASAIEHVPGDTFMGKVQTTLIGFAAGLVLPVPGSMESWAVANVGTGKQDAQTTRRISPAESSEDAVSKSFVVCCPSFPWCSTVSS